jgi:hypothetical protein
MKKHFLFGLNAIWALLRKKANTPWYSLFRGSGPAIGAGAVSNSMQKPVLLFMTGHLVLLGFLIPK